MRVTINVEDGKMIIDKEVHDIDFADLAAQDIDAVQWYDDHGEIEYRTHWLKDERRWDRKPNKVIDSFADFEPYVERWRARKKLFDETRAAHERYTWPEGSNNADDRDR